MEVDTEDREISNVDATASNAENSKESVNEDVPICSRGISDVFPKIVNKLDVKSYMNLAKTCKQLYKRCMEDKAIKINVEEYILEVYGDAGGLGVTMNSSFASERHLRSYIATLRKQRFNLSLSTVEIDLKPDDACENCLDGVQNYLQQLGVSRIKILKIAGLRDWEELIPFIKKFHISILGIKHSFVPLTSLRSLLQLTLNSFIYYKPVPIDFILELGSPVKNICLNEIDGIDWPKFMQILWKIQSGTLNRLIFAPFDWDEIEIIDYDIDDKEQLTDERPLIFHRDDGPRTEEFYFLHWQGGVTKCIDDDVLGHIDIFKCPPSEFPPILREDEDVLKDLADMVPAVGCFKCQFKTFMDTLTLIEPSFEGPLPPERPLYFKAQNGFLKLKDDDTLMRCTWNDTRAIWKPTKSARSSPSGYRALAKLLFNKYIRKPTAEGKSFICEGVEELDFWLENYKKLDFEYADSLPNERPLIFKKTASEEGDKKLYVILFEDLLLECTFSNTSVYLRSCESWNRPPILINAKAVKEILQEEGWGLSTTVVRKFRVDHETLLSGFQLFKMSLCDSYNRRHLVFEKTQIIDETLVEESWFNHCGVFKMVWKDGYASISKVDPHKISFEFMKQIFTECAQRRYMYDTMDLFMNLEQFESCLGQFERKPFDYCGPLPKDRVLTLVKKEIHHICFGGPKTWNNCGCSEPFYRVWFLSEGVNIFYCLFGSNTPRRVVFSDYKNVITMPPILKTREYLKYLLEMPELQYGCWYGTHEDFIACFENYTRISLSHKGPLPEKRPLFMERKCHVKPSLYLLRKDKKIIECQFSKERYGTSLKMVLPFSQRIPTVLMSAL